MTKTHTNKYRILYCVGKYLKNLNGCLFCIEYLGEENIIFSKSGSKNV